VACAGTLAPPVPSPAAVLADRLQPAPDGLDALDGAFAGAPWDGDRRRLTLVRDPFGIRSLYCGRRPGLRPRHGAKTWLLLTLEAWLRTIVGRRVPA
jgi:asparagine synthase (glutamine-hydrolysing)